MRTLVLERGPEVRRWILAGLVVGVPVLFLRMMNDPFNVPKLALLVVGVTVVGGIRAVEVLQGAEWRGLLRASIPAATFVIPLTVAWVFAPYRGWSLLGAYGRFQGFLPYVVAVLFGVLVADAFYGRTRMLAWAFLIGGAIVGGYGVVQFIGLDPFEWAIGGLSNNQTTSTIGNPNFVGGFLGIVLPVGIALFLTEEEEKKWVLRLLIAVAGGWVLSRSEGGWAAGAAGSAVLIGAWGRVRWGHARLAGFFVAAFVAITVIGWVAFSVSRSSVPTPNNTAALRGGWWISASRMAAESPVLGHGPDAFSVEGVQYRTTEDALTQRYDYTDDPHSVPFDLLASGGVLLVAGYLFVLGWNLRQGLVLPDEEIVAIGLSGAVVAYAVQSIVSIDQIPLMLALWGSLGGVAAAGAASVARSVANPSARTKARSSGKKVVRVVQPLQRSWAIVLVALLVLAPVWWCGRILLADARALQARQLFSKGESQKGAMEWRRAIALHDFPLYQHRLGIDAGGSALAAGGDESLEQAMAEAFTYLRGFPDVGGLRDFGRLLHELGRSDEAVIHYERAFDLDDQNPELALELAEVLLDLDRYEEAESLLARYITAHEAALADAAAAGLSFPRLWAGLADARFEQDDYLGGVDALEALIPSDQRDDFAAQKLYGILYEDGGAIEKEELAPLWAYYALVEARKGNVPQAHDAIEVAESLGADSEHVAAAIELVGEPEQP